jgi:ankyrin repeat protein
VAAKHNSLDALKILIDTHVFNDEVVRKDYNGNTPLHIAKKKQHTEIHEFFVQNLPENARQVCLEIEIDLGINAVM